MTDGTPLRPAYCLAVAPAAAVGAIAALAHQPSVHAVDVVRFVLVVIWAATGLAVGVRRRHDRIGPIALTAAGVGVLGMLADGYGHPALARAALGVLPAVGLHLLVALPDGRIGSRTRQITVAAAYVVGAVVGVIGPQRTGGPALWPSALLWIVAVAIGLPVANARYRKAGTLDQRRMQWLGWAMLVTTEIVIVVIALRLMADWPPKTQIVALAATALLPASLVAGTHARMIARVDRLLTHTIALAGLTALVVIAYVVVIVGLGRSLHDGERSLLLWSMVATILAALAYVPMRNRLTHVANQLVYGEQVAPDEALRTWGSRLTRAIPLDELLLQLAESLRKSMQLESAEVYTGSTGRYEIAAGVPHRAAPVLTIEEKDRAVVARAGVSGGTWLDVWLPQLAGANAARTRVAPVSHGGELLGLIVLTRRTDGDPFSTEDDRVLAELARQIGLALHNVQLDSALQASLEELQHRNTELQESRLRIVAAGDAERRKLERNLHDGAQQRLVAMAVKLRIAEELVDEDPQDAVATIVDLRGNLKEAIEELRALAHGVFPPLLASGGLVEALPSAASRAAVATYVDAPGIGRYTPAIESTVYFCCMEAMQNAGKHAGPDAEMVIRVKQADGELVFEACDDGTGFTVEPGGAAGHGFINMTDRLGAVGGRLEVVSAPGAGTQIRGIIPLVSISS